MILNAVVFVSGTSVGKLLLVVSVGSTTCRSATFVSSGLVTVDGGQCSVTVTTSSVVVPAVYGGLCMYASFSLHCFSSVSRLLR